MLFYTVGQSRIFLTMLYAGLAVGLYVSLDSAARRLFRPGPVFSLAMDLLFGLIAACITCIALVAAADGELRLYSLLGVLSGALIYMGTVDPLLNRAGSLLLRPLNALLGWIKQRSFIN